MIFIVADGAAKDVATIQFNDAYDSLPTRSNTDDMQTNVAYGNTSKGLQANAAYDSITGLRADPVYDTITGIQDNVPTDAIQNKN